MGSRNEHPSTYFVPDRSSKDDLARLQVLDQMMTAAMGGVLSEQPGSHVFHRVLDVGCGTGSWLIEMARTTPTNSEVLVGVDVSRTMVEYARAQAAAVGVSDRVKFETMDALRTLEFPDHYFDLVNQRFGASYLRTWDWPKLLQEYRRVMRPHGVVRLTEGEWMPESSNPALTRLFDLLLTAFYHSGHSFTCKSAGVTDELESLLQRYGFHNIHHRLVSTHYHVGMNTWQPFFEDMKLTFRMILPFLHKWTIVPDDYEEIYQQALQEMLLTDFVASGGILTVWGQKEEQ